MDEEEIPGLTIDLDDEAQKKEVELKLTLGQLLLINEFLSKHIQPKGFLMIEFSYDLFKRLNDAILSVTPKEEAFTAKEDF
tara:strand:+ start:824 stop:1066 length:243 start_codon:yes stop_codon:yes gene_type:complete